ncbi:hypothetical protein DL89DRAFT_268405 [Linderina pennispora]|uniref:Uncharacterized protein n=1 Tax=Linderina pennispora TaxID=61395 RepID=A0A1Y1W503_9FUNG|nr:uncharacterized protein DL89DRAFT_268405 [Linderina pennispora]ORX68609.1 hypothetical protein DL89DRAFT_268405 [Linderina pennispora]
MSLENVSRKWYPNIVRYAPGLPVVIAGLKLDLRNDIELVENLAKSGTHPVTETEGRRMAKRIGAKAYVECSALDCRGIDRIFQRGAQAAVISKDFKHRCNQPDRAQCVIQ